MRYSQRKENAVMKKAIMIVAVLLFIVTVTACEKEGPAERAGEKIDKTMESLKEKME
jgi:hyperosmotically inducible protein